MIFIATPTGHTVDIYYHNAICGAIAHLTNNKIAYTYKNLDDCNLARSRAILTQQFLLKADADRLLFIDSDMYFTAQDIIDICKHDLDVVSGVYTKRTVGKIATFKSVIKQEGKLLQVNYVPTGFLMIQRKVIEGIVAAHPELKFQHGTAIYDNIIDDDGTYLSTDFSFSKRARKLGYELFIDTNINLGHAGTHLFTP